MIPDHHALWYKTTSASQYAEVVLSAKEESEVIELGFDSVTIADARMVIDLANRKPSASSVQTLVIKALSINTEAQHALLKVIEEPPLSTRFIFFIPETAVILGTIWSRVFVVNTAVEDLVTVTQFADFLKLSLADRVALIGKIADAKNVSAWNDLQSGLDDWLRSANIAKTTSVATIAWCRVQLGYKGSSKKMLWEELAFCLPVNSR